MAAQLYNRKDTDMPVKLERKLKKQAKAEGMRGKRLNAYVYGTLRKTGWKPQREK